MADKKIRFESNLYNTILFDLSIYWPWINTFHLAIKYLIFIFWRKIWQNKWLSSTDFPDPHIHRRAVIAELNVRKRFFSYRNCFRNLFLSAAYDFVCLYLCCFYVWYVYNTKWTLKWILIKTGIFSGLWLFLTILSKIISNSLEQA